MGRIGLGELILILIIALVVFGPAKLPEIGKAVGKGMREFKNAARGLIQLQMKQGLKAKTGKVPKWPRLVDVYVEVAA